MNWLNQIIYFGGESYLAWESIKVSGPDATEFLSGQLTNEVSTLPNQTGNLNAAIDIKGKINAYFFLLKNENEYWLITPAVLKEALIQRLEKFIIMEDVTVKSSDKKFQISNKKEAQGFQCQVSGETFVLAEADSQSELNLMMMDYLTLLGVNYGHLENISETMLTDTLLVHNATSFTKGCFLGQEIVAKIYNNRGSAYASVLLQANATELITGDYLIDNRKAGTIEQWIEIGDEQFGIATLFRDFRVDQREFTIQANNSSHRVKVKLYPFFKLTAPEKARQLYEMGLEEFTHKNNSENAIQYLKQAIIWDEKLADAYETLAVILGRGEKYDEAIHWLKILEKVAPNSVMVHTNLSLFYMRQGKIQEAEDEKAKATVKSFAMFGNEAAQKRQLEKEREQKKAELSRREEMFKQVIEIDSDDTLANFGMGEISYEKNDYSAALNYFEKVLLVDAKYSTAYLGLVKTLTAIKAYQKAKEICDQGIVVAAARGDFNTANEMQNLLINLQSKI
ncbi:MAG: tetratricopeptide repeat protein [Bacteriovoracaceae bacterium]|nr:tetratricopeptide repeat protein [Bacteriovoracaceae bacterium]